MDSLVTRPLAQLLSRFYATYQSQQCEDVPGTLALCYGRGWWSCHQRCTPVCVRVGCAGKPRCATLEDLRGQPVQPARKSAVGEEEIEASLVSLCFFPWRKQCDWGDLCCLPTFSQTIALTSSVHTSPSGTVSWFIPHRTSTLAAPPRGTCSGSLRLTAEWKDLGTGHGTRS